MASDDVGSSNRPEDPNSVFYLTNCFVCAEEAKKGKVDPSFLAEVFLQQAAIATRFLMHKYKNTDKQLCKMETAFRKKSRFHVLCASHFQSLLQSVEAGQRLRQLRVRVLLFFEGAFLMNNIS